MSSSWPLPPPTETAAADPEVGSTSAQLKSSSPPSSVTLSSRSKTALFMHDRFWWGAAAVLALWIGYLFQVIAVAKDGWTDGSTSASKKSIDWNAGMWALCEEGICVSWDTIYGTLLPGSCTTSRAVGVITLIAGGAALLGWIALLGVQLLSGGPSLTDPSAIRSLRKRKLRLVLISSAFHWVSALFAIVTCISMKNFMTEAGLMAVGHWSYCLVLWVLGLVVQAIVPCLMRFTLETNLDR